MNETILPDTERVLEYTANGNVRRFQRHIIRRLRRHGASAANCHRDDWHREGEVSTSWGGVDAPWRVPMLFT